MKILLKNCIRECRLPFLTASVIPFIIGTAYAYYQYHIFNGIIAVLGLFSLVGLHLGANILNDYFDYRSGNDAVNQNWSPFNGGSRVIQDGLLLPNHVLLLGLFCLGIAIVTGFVLYSLIQNSVILLLGGLGILCGIGYTMPPFKWGYRGIGEAVIGLSFGPLIVIGAYFIQIRKMDLQSLFIGIPIGLLIQIVLLINEIPDLDADQCVEKKTWVVLFKERWAVVIAILNIIFAYLIVLICIFIQFLPVHSLVVLGTLPLFILIWLKLNNYLNGSSYSYQANQMMIQLHLLFGLLLSSSLLLSGLSR